MEWLANTTMSSTQKLTSNFIFRIKKCKKTKNKKSRVTRNPTICYTVVLPKQTGSTRKTAVFRSDNKIANSNSTETIIAMEEIYILYVFVYE